MYPNTATPLSALKEGILLVAGIAAVTPNVPKDISSWTYDYAAGNVPITDNRARDVKCYHPGYILVEKLQTISTKFRQQQESDSFPINFMRHYCDVYFLLHDEEVQAFIGTAEYHAHKKQHFRSGDNPVIAANEAFLLSDATTRQVYQIAYEETPRALYYKDQPAFDEIMGEIQEASDRL